MSWDETPRIGRVEARAGRTDGRLLYGLVHRPHPVRKVTTRTSSPKNRDRLSSHRPSMLLLTPNVPWYCHFGLPHLKKLQKARFQLYEGRFCKGPLVLVLQHFDWISEDSQGLHTLRRSNLRNSAILYLLHVFTIYHNFDIFPKK